MISKKFKIFIIVVLAAGFLILLLRKSPAGGSVQTVNFKSGDTFFDTPSIKAKVGTNLLFKVQNTGRHTFMINELNFRKELPEGKSEFTLKLDKKGIFTYYCDVSGHRAAGQFGTLFVE